MVRHLTAVLKSRASRWQVAIPHRASPALVVRTLSRYPDILPLNDRTLWYSQRSAAASRDVRYVRTHQDALIAFLVNESHCLDRVLFLCLAFQFGPMNPAFPPRRIQPLDIDALAFGFHGCSYGPLPVRLRIHPALDCLRVFWQIHGITILLGRFPFLGSARAVSITWLCRSL